MSKTGELPLIMRREAYGGIAFDPFDGTMLELDHEGFDLTQKILEHKGFFFNAEKRAFAAEIKEKLHYNRFRDLRLMDRDPWPSAVPVPSLSAPTLVDFQITEKCYMGCPHCYASSVDAGDHVSWDDLKLVVQQMKDCGVMQVALGGGEPLIHPEIIPLLQLCHEAGIVPNLTTGGMNFSDKKLRALRDYCGAVGISMEGVGKRYERWRSWGFDNFLKSLTRMKEANVPTVIQITLSARNIGELDEMVDFLLTQKHLYGVIFLAYKNVGRGITAANNLGTIDPATVSPALKKAFDRLRPHMRVGYDCCMTPGIAGVEEEAEFADASNLEGCSATRGSVGVSASLDVSPCTFTGEYNLGNLKKNHLRDIWQGRTSEAFRRRIHYKSVKNTACGGCQKQGSCFGGCPVMPLVNCHRDHLKSHEFPSPAISPEEEPAAVLAH